MIVTPNTGIIRALCAQSLDHRRALCEWIDNALDAKAQAISITFGKGRRSPVEVADDGCGKGDLRVFAELGGSERHPSTRSGTYGIGSKDASLWYGGERAQVVVKSVHNGVGHSLMIDWWHMAQNNWRIADPEIVPALTHSGTQITVSPCLREPPCGQEWQKLLDDLGYIYSRALKRGIQIKLRARGGEPSLLVPWQFPAFIPDSIIDAQVKVAGKTVRVYAGMVADGHANPRPGLTYQHAFRVIIPSSSRGCGGAQINRITGFVDIGDDWSRSKNKDDIQHADELYLAVEAKLRPLLERAEKAGLELQHNALADAVAARVNAWLGLGIADAKAVRSSKKSTGVVIPIGSGRKHKRANREQPGSTFHSKRRAGGAVRVMWSMLDNESIGRVLGNDVELNESNPFMAQIKAAGNADAIALAVASLVSARHCIEGDKQALFNIGRPFTDVLGECVSRPVTTDVKPQLHVVPE